MTLIWHYIHKLGKCGRFAPPGRKIARLAGRLSDDLGPAIGVEAEAGRVVLSGDGLEDRYGNQAELRWRIAGAWQ